MHPSLHLLLLLNLLKLGLNTESQKAKSRVDPIYTSFSKLRRLDHWQMELMFALSLRKADKCLYWLRPKGRGRFMLAPRAAKLH